MDIYSILILTSFLIVIFLVVDAVKTRNKVKERILSNGNEKFKKLDNEDLMGELLMSLISQRTKFNKIETQIHELKVQNEGIFEKIENISINIIPYKSYYNDYNHKIPVYGTNEMHGKNKTNLIESHIPVKRWRAGKANISINNKSNQMAYGN